MGASGVLIAKIKEFEGKGPDHHDGMCYAYKCPAGVLTIGYGHTEGVKAGMIIKESDAEALLITDVQSVEDTLKGYAFDYAGLTQGQKDAIIDFCFNLGCAKFHSSTLYRKIKANVKDKTIPAEFRKWCHAGKVVLKGLQRRREWEAERWNS